MTSFQKMTKDMQMTSQNKAHEALVVTSEKLLKLGDARLARTTLNLAKDPQFVGRIAEALKDKDMPESTCS